MNGVKVAGPKDFHVQNESVVKSVTVLAQNTISIELRGAPGKSISVTIARAPTFTLFTNPADPLFLRAELSNGDIYDYFGDKNSQGFATSLHSLSVRSANGATITYSFDEQSQTVEIHAFNGLTLKLQQQSRTQVLATVISADGLIQVTVPIDLSQQARNAARSCPAGCGGEPAALVSPEVLLHSLKQSNAIFRSHAIQNTFQEACESALQSVASVCRFANTVLGLSGARAVICAAIVSAVALVPGGVALVPAILSACQPVLVSLQTACFLVQIGNITGFSSYLCQRIANVFSTPQSHAYITNSLSSTVSVIRTDSNTVLTTIPVLGFPIGVAVNRLGTRAYITHNGSGVSVIDTTTNTVIANTITGVGAQGVAVTPDGKRVYVTNTFNDNVSVLDSATNTVIKNVPVGNGPIGIVAHPAGTRVYVSNLFSGTVSVIDTATNNVVATISGGPTVFLGGYPDISTDGKRLYIGMNASAVAIIDTVSNSIIGAVPVGNGSFVVAVNPSGTRVYVASNTSTVSVVDTSTNSVIAVVPVGNSPRGIAVTPDGKRVYVTNSGNGTVSVINADTNVVTSNIAVGLVPEALGRFIRR